MKPVTPAPWSFSKIKSFDTCPKQFYHEKVLKEYPFVETEAMRYGTEFHKAAELFIKDGTPIPDKFDYAADMLQVLKAKPGEKLCEYKFGLTADLEACSFFDKKVWFRGIIDLAILNGAHAHIIDYKTGKSAQYAEKGQLELMALATYKHFPQIERVTAGLVFVIADELVGDKYRADNASDLWQKWLSEYAKMEAAFESGVWNPRPSGLCKRHCPVTECPHNGAN